MTNSVDPDKKGRYMSYHLALYCLQRCLVSLRTSNEIDEKYNVVFCFGIVNHIVVCLGRFNMKKCIYKGWIRDNVPLVSAVIDIHREL